MLNPKTIEKHKAKKLLCPTCQKNVSDEPDESPFNIMILSLIGFAFLMLLILPLLGCEREIKRVEVISQEQFVVSANTRYFNRLMQRAEISGVSIPCYPVSGQRLEPCLTQDIEALVNFIEYKKGCD